MAARQWFTLIWRVSILLVCAAAVSVLVYSYFVGRRKTFRSFSQINRENRVLVEISRTRPTVLHTRRRRSTVIQPSEPCLVQTRSRRSTDDGVWYNFTSSSFQFYAYTAFLDDRPSLLSPPIVRIIAMSTKLEDVVKRIPVTLYCGLHYEGQTGSKLVRMDSDPKPIGFGWPLNNELVREYVYSCQLSDSNSIPVAVSILRFHEEDPTQVNVTSCMPVELPPKPANPRDFAVCVPVAFGTGLSPHRVIEWLEMQRLLGVSLVGVYCMDDVREPVLGVLRRYVEEGFVDLRFTNYIAHGREQHWLHSTPAVNDCMYRYMYSFRYMLVIDLDELILPDSFSNLRELVDFLNRNTSRMKPINYEFRNSYFFLDIPAVPLNDEEGTMSNLTLVKHRTKVKLSPPGYSIKSIINPQACVHMHNHYCFGVTPGFKSRPIYSEVDSTIATNRHYKRCHFKSDECKNMMANVTRDDVMLRFAPQLQQLVNEKMASSFAYLLSAG